MGRSFNLRNKEEKKAFINAGGHKNKCPYVCGRAAKITAEILEQRNINI